MTRRIPTARGGTRQAGQRSENVKCAARDDVNHGERVHDAADSHGCRERSSATGSSPAAMEPVFASTTR